MQTEIRLGRVDCAFDPVPFLQLVVVQSGRFPTRLANGVKYFPTGIKLLMLVDQ